MCFSIIIKIYNKFLQVLLHMKQYVAYFYSERWGKHVFSLY